MTTILPSPFSFTLTPDLGSFLDMESVERECIYYQFQLIKKDDWGPCGSVDRVTHIVGLCLVMVEILSFGIFLNSH